MSSATAPESVATDIALPTAWKGCDVADDTFDAALWSPTSLSPPSRPNCAVCRATATRSMSALGAVMRKILVVMRAVVISGKPYQKRYVSACGKVGEKGPSKERKTA